MTRRWLVPVTTLVIGIGGTCAALALSTHLGPQVSVTDTPATVPTAVSAFAGEDEDRTCASAVTCALMADDVVWHYADDVTDSKGKVHPACIFNDRAAVIICADGWTVAQ